MAKTGRRQRSPVIGRATKKSASARRKTKKAFTAKQKTHFAEILRRLWDDADSTSEE